MHRFLPDEPAHAGGRGCPGLGGLSDAVSIIADSVRRFRVVTEQIGRRHDRIERIVDVMHDAGSQAANR